RRHAAMLASGFVEFGASGPCRRSLPIEVQRRWRRGQHGILVEHAARAIQARNLTLARGRRGARRRWPLPCLRAHLQFGGLLRGGALPNRLARTRAFTRAGLSYGLLLRGSGGPRGSTGLPFGHRSLSFRNLDSLAISVVRSDAYRDFKLTSRGAGARQKFSGNRSTLPTRLRVLRRGEGRQEDAQGMANVEDENTPGAGGGAGVATSERSERSDRTDRGTLKARPRDDDEQMDPAEYARLLDSYDNSFRNIAE